MTRDAFAMLAEAAAGCPPDPEIWRWFCDGCRGFQHGLRLELALGLTYAGRVSRRNAALAAAADALRGGRDISNWDVARELEARLKRFGPKSARWRRTGATDEFDRVDHQLLRADLAGAPPIGSARQLLRLIDLFAECDKDSIPLSQPHGDDGITSIAKEKIHE